MKAEKPNDKQFKEVEELVRKALAEKEQQRVDTHKKLMHTIDVIAEKDNEIKWLKKENEESKQAFVNYAECLNRSEIKAIISPELNKRIEKEIQKRVQQALSELRDEIMKMPKSFLIEKEKVLKAIGQQEEMANPRNRKARVGSS